MSTTQGKRPTHRAFYEVKGRDDKKVRDIEMGDGGLHIVGMGYCLMWVVAPRGGVLI